MNVVKSCMEVTNWDKFWESGLVQDFLRTNQRQKMHTENQRHKVNGEHLLTDTEFRRKEKEEAGKDLMSRILYYFKVRRSASRNFDKITFGKERYWVNYTRLLDHEMQKKEDSRHDTRNSRGQQVRKNGGFEMDVGFHDVSLHDLAGRLYEGQKGERIIDVLSNVLPGEVGQALCKGDVCPLEDFMKNLPDGLSSALC